MEDPDSRSETSTRNDEGTVCSAPSTSSLSCEPCRRRKAKCDRQLPTCNVCIKYQHACTYPAKRLRPGPKTGSTQKKPRLSKKNKDAVPGRDGRRPSGSIDGSGISISSIITQAENERAENDRDDRGRRDSYTSPSRVLLSPETTVAPTTITNRDGETTGETEFSFEMRPSHPDAFSMPATDSIEAICLNLKAPHEVPACITDQPDAILHTCHALNVSLKTFQRLLDSYFANMTSFSLFHQPTFTQKLLSIGQSLYLNALLASMFSFSARFETLGSDPASQAPSEIPCADHFHQLALRFEEESLTYCVDETPPLCFLQAITLTTYFQLTKGVHGRGWRWLGTCLRVAYEHNLHLIDADKPANYIPSTDQEAATWSSEEERRRCWWAIWEMDTFASTVRRVPTSIDWSHNKTLLPVEDRLWFKRQFHPSCLLPLRPMDRWKLLQRSGNECSTAWLIVVNSLMRDAQVLSNIGANPAWIDEEGSDPNSTKDVGEKLTTLSNSLNCVLLALPDALQYHNEYLNFTSLDPSDLAATRMVHTAKYSIYIMAQLTRFMIYHHYTFNAEPSTNSAAGLGKRLVFDERHSGARLMCINGIPNIEGLKLYAEAADNVVMILNRTSADHVRYVNPFLASTIWLAAAVHLVNQYFGSPKHSKDLLHTNFEVLRLTYQQFVKFWGTPIALLHGLESLEGHLTRFLHPDLQYPDSAKEPGSSESAEQERSSRFLNGTKDRNTPANSMSRSPRPASTKCTRTEPNLTGSGVNPNMCPAHHAAKITSSEMSSEMVPPAREHHGHVSGPYLTMPSDELGFEHNSALNLNDLDFNMDFDFTNDAHLPSYLNSLLSGSYSQGIGPS